jgi:bifunctional non-homologous end joining protein LigD
MWKYKFLADASCRVKEGRPGKRSVGLELLDENGQWVSVGNVTIGSPKIPLPLPGQVIDVIYLYAHRGGALYQPIFNGVRDDINENDCAMSQLKYKAEEE